MRLRSSKFVVLLLLACCVQLADDVALRLLVAPMLRSAGRGDSLADAQLVVRGVRTGAQFRPALTGLPAAAQAFTQIAWTMRRPAAHSAATTHHTGFLRA